RRTGHGHDRRRRPPPGRRPGRPGRPVPRRRRGHDQVARRPRLPGRPRLRQPRAPRRGRARGRLPLADRRLGTPRRRRHAPAPRLTPPNIPGPTQHLHGKLPRMRPSALLLTLCILAPHTPSLAAEAPPAPREWKIDGVARQAILYLPAAAQKSDAPVIFAFHG